MLFRSPVWSSELNALLFTDLEQNRVYKWSAETGLENYLQPAGNQPDDKPLLWRGACGLAIDAEGHLLLAQHGDRKLVKMRGALDKPQASFDVLASHYQNKRLNSPNDIALHPDGSVYFTDPPYGLNGFENSPLLEQVIFGVYRLDKAGQLQAVVTDLDKPNGIGISADGKLLYVSVSEPENTRLMVYPIDAGGAVGKGSQLYNAREQTKEGPGAMDGLVVFNKEVLIVTLPNGFGWLTTAGKLLAKWSIGQVTNVEVDQDKQFLYITTPKRLLRLALVP